VALFFKRRFTITACLIVFLFIPIVARNISLNDLSIRRTLLLPLFGAGWSSLVARKAHNLEVSGSNAPPRNQMNVSWR
jgi:hypothetical protein